MHTKTLIAHDPNRNLWRVEVFADTECVMSKVAHTPDELRRLSEVAKETEVKAQELYTASLVTGSQPI